MVIIGRKGIQKLSNELKALQQSNIMTVAANVNRNVALYPDWRITENTKRYVTTDDIYSIISFLTTTAAMIPLYAYEVKSDKFAKQLNSVSKPWLHPLHTKALEIKALEDLNDSDPLYNLLENPSYDFSKFEFLEAIYHHLFTDGEAFIYKLKPEEGTNAGKVVSMATMNPQNVILKASETLPRRVVGYDYVVNGQKIYENIPEEDVIHIKYYNPELTFSGSELRGLSPLKVLCKRLVQLDSNTNVQTAQLQNGGVETIVFDESVMDEAAKQITDSRKDNFYKFLSNPQNAGAPFFATGKMGAVKLGSTLADLKVIESAKVTFQKFCNAYHVSDVLFNNNEASTESNVKEQTTRLYTNSILPNVMRVRDALKKGLLPEFKDKKRDIREDISEISELQPNSKEMADWLAVAYWVTPNEKREMMRFEKFDDPLFDRPILPAGLQTLDDLNAIPDIPIVTPNGL